jgi:hypothetical protein
MKRLLLILLILIAILGGIIFFQPQLQKQNTRQETTVPSSPTQSASQKRSPSMNPEDALIFDISGDFAKKYNKPRENIILTIDKQTDKHAVGSVQFKNEFGGGLWFAANVDGVWKLAYDGQQIMTCDVAEQYNFPNTIVEQCYDLETNEAVVR